MPSATKLDARQHVTRAPGVLAQRLDDELVLLDANLGHYFALNSTGATVWEWIGPDGARIGDLVELLVDRYAVAREEGDEDVRRLIDELAGQGLVRVGGPSDTD